MKNVALNKIVSIILFSVFVSVICVCFAGCEPDFGKNSFKYGDNYRVIELDESKTQFIEDYGVEGVVSPEDEGKKVTFVMSHDFMDNTLFFSTKDQFPAAAFEAVYHCLGVEKHPKVTDVSSYTCSSSNLYTRNEMILHSGNSTATVIYENGMMPGFLMDSYVYTFNYTDYSRDREVLGTGSFRALFCTHETMMGLFEYDKFTDLYSF